MVDKFDNKFLKFTKGDENPKGGMFKHDYGERVYLVDEAKFGHIMGETRQYCWVNVEDEEYANERGRRKMKHNVRSSIS